MAWSFSPSGKPVIADRKGHRHISGEEVFERGDLSDAPSHEIRGKSPRPVYSAASQFHSISDTLTRKLGYTCVEATLIVIDQLPLLPRRAGANTATLDREKCPSTSVAKKTSQLCGGKLWVCRGRGQLPSTRWERASWVGGIEDSKARNGIVKENILQIVSMTNQIAISRKLFRSKLKLRGCQGARKSTGGGRGTNYHFWRSLVSAKRRYVVS